MILEGIVTSLSPSGDINIAPMGPRVEGADFRRFLLRPYPTSQTYRNLKAHGEGVLHVTDDVLLLAKAAVGPVAPAPALRPAQTVRGWVLETAARAYEFRVASMDESEERIRIEAEVLHIDRRHDLFGFNRAKHAVVEAAILATRTAFLLPDEIEAEYHKLAVIVGKTGGPDERAAFEFLRAHVDQVLRERRS